MEVITSARDISERKQAEEALNTRIEEEHTFQNYLKELHEITIELTQIDDVDQFYRRSVELARTYLGFERMALFLYNEQDGSAQGTYGTDLQGNVVDEGHIRFVPSPDGIMLRAFQRAERFYFEENVPLLNNEQPVGTGWNVATVLWNGTRSVGWLVADNLVSQSPASKPVLDILGLYGMTLGTLLVHKQDQAALRQSEERFRRLLNAAPLATVISDQSGAIALINSQAEALFGYDRDELIGQQVEILVPQHARDKHVQHRVDYLTAPRVRRMGAGLEFFAIRKDGSQFPVEIELSFIETDAGMLVMSFVVDITERKATAAALEEQRSFLRNVIDVSPSLIFVKDYDGRFILANTMLAQAYDTTAEALIGKTDADFSASQDEVNDYLKADRQVITSREPLYLEESLTSINGEIHWFQTTKVPVLAGDGKSRYVLGISTDITELKRAEETLRQAFEKERELGELKSRFVSMSSHEFRTPLATILALTDTLSAYRHKLSEEQIETRFGKIREQIEHLKNIMEDVLQLARLQARRTEFNPVRLNLDGLCRSVLDEFESHPNMKHQLAYSRDEMLHDVLDGQEAHQADYQQSGVECHQVFASGQNSHGEPAIRQANAGAESE